jgi:hypothetical protein
MLPPFHGRRSFFCPQDGSQQVPVNQATQLHIPEDHSLTTCSLIVTWNVYKYITLHKVYKNRPENIFGHPRTN